MDQKARRELHQAMSANRISDVRNIIKKGFNGMTPLHDAASLSTPQVIEAVLKFHDIEEKNALGQTALMVAVRHRKYVNAKYLINMGANLNTEDNDGVRLIHQIAYNIIMTIVDEFFRLFRVTGSIEGVLASYLRWLTRDTMEFGEYLMKLPGIEKSPELTASKRQVIKDRVDVAFNMQMVDVKENYGEDVANYLYNQFYRHEILWN